jgi:hypothetical protein
LVPDFEILHAELAFDMIQKEGFFPVGFDQAKRTLGIGKR